MVKGTKKKKMETHCPLKEEKEEKKEKKENVVVFHSEGRGGKKEKKTLNIDHIYKKQPQFFL